MKKFLLFITILVSGIVTGQDNVPASNNYSEMSANYRAELGSGNFVYNISLFDIGTMSPDFSLQGNLYYNAQAAATTLTAEGIMGHRGWGADFLPSIYRSINSPNSLCDELYYKTDTYEVNADYQPYSRPYRDKNDLFEFNVFGLRGAFRLIYNADNTVDVQLASANAYVEIIPNCLVTSNGINGKNISLNGFTIKDANGISYRFEEAEDSGLRQDLSDGYSLLIDPNWDNGQFHGYLQYKRAFLLSDITDKYQRTLVQYIYKTYPNTLGAANNIFSYDQKVIDKIKVINKSDVVLNTNKSKITSIEVNNYTGDPLKKIILSSPSVIFRNKDNIEEKRYQFLYNPVPYDPSQGTPPLNTQGNYLKRNNQCIDTPLTAWLYDYNVQDYSAGLLKTITLPHKGKINIEYETNTYRFGDMGKLWNNLNYDFIEVPVTYNSSNDTYSFQYGTLSSENDEGYYLQFHSTIYTDPLLQDENGNPLRIYPGFQIYSTGSNPVLLQGFAFEDQCANGEEFVRLSARTMVLKRNGGTAANISNVKVYKKTIKPENERINYCFGPSVRVKKITNTDHSGTLLNEKSYSYQDPADDKLSSGIISYLLWYQVPLHQVTRPTSIFYKYITETEPGKGKTVYQMNWDEVVLPEFTPEDPAYQPKNIWKYNEAGQLVEHVNNTFETYPSSADSEAYHKIKKINSVLKSYEGTAFKTTTTEKVLDTVSMLPVYNKITEESIGQTFIEQYTNEKLGNAFYRTAVEKTKNSAALNKSTFTYQQQGTTQAYNLKTVSVAKENRPLEVEKEVTLTDNYGNVLEYKTKEGLVVSQVWGYNDSQVVAELKNVPYASIATATLTAIKTHSAGTAFNEANLTTALNSLRTAFPDAFVTTYTYKPLVGISTVTDANGRKETYQYDDFNRLYRVLNHEGLVIKEYTYHLKN